MRGIIILVLLILLMVFAGWLTFGRDPGRTTINIETDKIQRDTESAVENTERMIDSGARVLSGEKSIDEESVVVDPHVGTVPPN
jgi:hypothetical protein